MKKLTKKIVLITGVCLLTLSLTIQAKPNKTYPILPSRLKVGDTVGLVSPGYRVTENIQIQFAIERMQALGLKVKLGKHVYTRYGYLAGTDENRADDINQMFADPEVKAIIALRGGWGSNRILGLLKYKTIKNNPKIFMGYSDITSLLLAINAKTGLVTFHGPMAVLTWNEFTTNYAKDILFNAKKITFSNPIEKEDDLTQTKNRIVTIRKGKASGKLLGGSLTLLTSMIGSKYLPKFNGAILFVEDIDEDIYKVDRMLTQLKTAGVLDKIAGFVFGKCTSCQVKNPTYGSLTFQQVLEHHIVPLKIPAWYGSMIGHDDKIFTLPEGTLVTIDAEKGTIEMLEPAVK
ncbi:MAG: LD-carboxypeptidase [Gammaproteobacteria bacterium]|nr:LD-carboxypeptidase [Gammaproteobacteria bacterium]